MPLAFLKTVDSRPMLRPPDLVSIEEVGEIVGLRSKGLAEVKFRRGTFLITYDKLNSEYTEK